MDSEEKEGDERIPLKSQIAYSKMYMSRETGGIILFYQENCKVLISVGLLAIKRCPVNSLFDTGAGPDLTCKDFVESKSLRAVQARNGPSLKIVPSQKVSVDEIIAIEDRMRGSRMRKVFQHGTQLSNISSTRNLAYRRVDEGHPPTQTGDSLT